MPRPGGEADKLGNRYEGIWTVSQLLQLLTGDLQSITVEPLDPAATSGIEFVTYTPSGTTEYHSVKRQHGREWSLAALCQVNRKGRCVLGDLFEKLAGDRSSRCCFVSATGANDLRELSERAQWRSTSQEFEQELRQTDTLNAPFEKYILPRVGDDRILAFDRLRRTSVMLIDEQTLTRHVEGQIALLLYRPDGEDVSADTVRLTLADFVLSRLGSSITAEDVLTHLASKGYRRRNWVVDPNIRARVATAQGDYLRNVELELINRSRIPRQESQLIIEELNRADGARTILLTAPAGYGKSCVLAQVIARLNEQGIPLMVVRLDRHGAAHSTRELGRQLDLPQSPAVVLNGIADGDRSILVVDQLDALSQASGRSPHLWDVFDRLREETLLTANMKLVLACRTFDLESDHRLRALTRDKAQFHHVDLGPLSEDTVDGALSTAGIAPDRLSGRQKEILQTPLHLMLYLEAADQANPEFTGIGQLFDRYWDRKQGIAACRLKEPTTWPAAIFALCDSLSQRQQLTAPAATLDEWPETAAALISEHVLVPEGSEVRFFHESFFDYAFARRFCARRQQLVEWLGQSEQHLFRRGQVRQILSYLRDQDPSAYSVELGRFLNAPTVRFHLKKMVLQWLGSLSDPSDDEWRVLQPLLDDPQLGLHVPIVLQMSLGWFDLLHRNGTLLAWLNSGNDRLIEIGLRTFWFLEIRRPRSAVVAGVLCQFRGRDAVWDQRLRAFFRWQGIHHSREMQDLFLDLLSDGLFDGGDEDNEDTWWQWLTEAATDAPAFVVEAISRWLDREIAGLEASGGLDSMTHGRSREVAGIIQPTADRAALSYARHIFPRVARLVELTADARRAGRDRIWPGRSTGPSYGVYGAILDGLVRAMRRLATDSPQAVEELTNDCHNTQSETIALVLFRTWSANPQHFASACVRFLTRSPRWLDFGYSGWFDGNGEAAISREAISLIVPHLPADLRLNLEAAAAGFTDDWEREYPEHFGRTAHLLLEAFGEANLSEARRRRLQELRLRFPDADLTLPTDHGDVAGIVGSPIPPEETARFTDEQWVAAMRQFNEGRGSPRVDPTRGTAVELSWVLEQQARSDRARFAGLVHRMEDTIHPLYFSAILDGLLGFANVPEDQRALDSEALRQFDTGVLLAVIRRLHDLPGKPCGREICRAFGRMADRAIPESDLAILEYYAIEDPDPAASSRREPQPEGRAADPEQLCARGINSVRGAAARAIMELLFGDYTRAGVLLPVLEQMAADPSLAVRACVFQALLPLLNHDRDRPTAVRLCLAACDGADALLGCNTLEQFIRYASSRHYLDLQPLLLRMRASKDQAAIRAAARQICLSAFDVGAAEADASAILAGTDDMRLAAAEIYARNLAHQSIEETCSTHLRRLFDDESEEIRKKAGDCFLFLGGQDIGRHEGLIRAYLESRAFPSPHDDLLRRLADSTWQLPDVVLRIAERFIEARGSRASDIQLAGFSDGSQVAKLVVRLYAQASDAAVKHQCLHYIDQMELHGFFGIDQELHRLDR
jgi:hypothetical protein